uniref:cell division cycle-associated protein 3 n=1 Tax=Pristiophorus japonicus TaxID=55135 RepID=UPI00398F8A06
MGSSGSTCMETPVRVVYNKHLGNVLDPRSPTSGILRTPIEVLSGQSPSPGGAEAELVEEEDEDEFSDPLDPRSPTPGVVRTPLKPTMTDKFARLVKQLSGVFLGGEAEAEAEDLVSPVAEAGSDEGLPCSEDPVTELLECEEEEEEPAEAGPEPEGEASLPGPSPTRCPVPAAAAGGPRHTAQTLPRNPLLEEGPRVVKRKRVKPAGTALLVSGSGRSPLQLLRDDNSPNSILARRQVKKTLGLSETPSDPCPRNLLKLGRSCPYFQDKENNSYRLLAGELTLCPP